MEAKHQKNRHLHVINVIFQPSPFLSELHGLWFWPVGNGCWLKLVLIGLNWSIWAQFWRFGPFSAYFRLKLDLPTRIDPPEKCEVDVKIYLPAWHVVTQIRPACPLAMADAEAHPWISLRSIHEHHSGNRFLAGERSSRRGSPLAPPASPWYGAAAAGCRRARGTRR